MKRNKLYLLSLGLVLATASCSEGQYWEEAGNKQEVYAFTKNTGSLSIPGTVTTETAYAITVSRNNVSEEVTIPLSFKELGYDDNNKLVEVSYGVITGPSEVTFEKGSYTATFNIYIDGSIGGDEEYYAQISLEPYDEENKIYVETPDNQVFNFTIYKEINWVPAGTAAAISYLAGNDEPIDVPVNYAENVDLGGLKLMRLVSPYYYLDPGYAPEGYDMYFYVTANNDAYAWYGDWQDTGEMSGNYNLYLRCIAARGDSFTNDGDKFKLVASIGMGEGEPEGYASIKETLEFTWSGYSE